MLLESLQGRELLGVLGSKSEVSQKQLHSPLEQLTEILHHYHVNGTIFPDSRNDGAGTTFYH